MARRFLTGYSFVIPENIWNSQYEFDDDLGRLFKAKGLDTEVIIDANEQIANRILSITVKTPEKVPQPPKKSFKIPPMPKGGTK